jgi:hypothetical protein
MILQITLLSNPGNINMQNRWKHKEMMMTRNYLRLRSLRKMASLNIRKMGKARLSSTISLL